MRQSLRLLVVSLLTCLSLGGQAHALSLWPLPCGGSLEGEFSFLYWKPQSDLESFAFSGNQENLENETLLARYRLGYQGIGRYWFPEGCGYVGAGLIWVEGHHTRSISGQGFQSPTSLVDIPADTTLALAKGKLGSRYVAADLEAGHLLAHCRCLDGFLFGGLRYVQVRERDRLGYALNTGDTFALRTKSEFNGVGPRIGIRGEYALPCGFSLFGQLAASMLFGNRTLCANGFLLESVLINGNEDASPAVLGDERVPALEGAQEQEIAQAALDPSFVVDPIRLQWHNVSRLFYQIDTRAGVEYSACCYGIEWNVKAGVAMEFSFDTVSSFLFIPGLATTGNFGIGGPFFSIGANF